MKNPLQITTNYALFFLILFGESCTIKNEVTLSQISSTKSIVNNQYAIPEREIVHKAEQFLIGLVNSSQRNGGEGSISSMNLSQKEAQIDMVVRYIDSQQGGIGSYEEIPVYVINYTDKRSNKSGGHVVISGDRRVNKIFVYSDTGLWNDENPLMAGFIHWFWHGVDKVLENELALLKDNAHEEGDGGNRSIHPPCPLCEYYYSYDIYDTAKRLPQLVHWDQVNPYNAKLEPACDPALPGLNSFYPTGCGVTAMGQIMAHNQKPTSGSYVNYLGQTVYTTYSWNEMTASPFIGSLTSSAQEQVQYLMAEIGKRTNTTYSCTAADVNIIKIKSGFTSMGYSYDAESWFNFATVMLDINANRPLLGLSYSPMPMTNSNFTDHAWMIDGYSRHTVEMTETRYCPTVPSGPQNPVVLKYYDHTDNVHCNIGDGLFGQNYPSGLFLNNTSKIISNIK